jgi:hypothetical protein
MKIEISECLVIRTDSMNIDRELSRVGVAALESRQNPVRPNVKNRRFTPFHGISRFFAPKTKKDF